MICNADISHAVAVPTKDTSNVQWSFVDSGPPADTVCIHVRDT